MELTQQVSK